MANIFVENETRPPVNNVSYLISDRWSSENVGSAKNVKRN